MESGAAGNVMIEGESSRVKLERNIANRIKEVCVGEG